jgi:hypothetical protein
MSLAALRGEDHMHRFFGRGVPGAPKAEFGEVDAGKKMFARAQQDWRLYQVDFVDQSGFEILPDGCDSTTEPDILPVRGFGGAAQRGVNAVGDEMKNRSALHGDRWARIVREDKNRRVVRRSLAPPSFPVVVGPGSANWTEHVAAENPGSDIFEPFGRKLFVDPGVAAFAPLYFLKCPGAEKPLVQGHAADPERIGEVLRRAGAEAVGRNGKAPHAQFAHAQFLSRHDIM